MVQPSDTIQHVKALTKKEEGLPPDEQFTLLLDGKILEDRYTVNDYGIQGGSTLFGSKGITIVALYIEDILHDAISLVLRK